MDLEGRARNVAQHDDLTPPVQLPQSSTPLVSNMDSLVAKFFLPGAPFLRTLQQHGIYPMFVGKLKDPNLDYVAFVSLHGEQYLEFISDEGKILSREEALRGSLLKHDWDEDACIATMDSGIRLNTWEWVRGDAVTCVRNHLELMSPDLVTHMAYYMGNNAVGDPTAYQVDPTGDDKVWRVPCPNSGASVEEWYFLQWTKSTSWLGEFVKEEI